MIQYLVAIEKFLLLEEINPILKHMHETRTIMIGFIDIQGAKFMCETTKPTKDNIKSFVHRHSDQIYWREYY